MEQTRGFNMEVEVNPLKSTCQLRSLTIGYKKSIDFIIRFMAVFYFSSVGYESVIRLICRWTSYRFVNNTILELFL